MSSYLEWEMPYIINTFLTARFSTKNEVIASKNMHDLESEWEKKFYPPNEVVTFFL